MWKISLNLLLIGTLSLMNVHGFVISSRPLPATVLTATTNDNDTTNRRRSGGWNVFRFLEQSSRFASPLSFLSNNQKRDSSITIRPGNVLWKVPDGKNDNPNAFTFAPLDDVIMGGVSSSKFDTTTGTWSGYVTDDNNGGFVGIRSTPNVQWDMSNCRGIQIELSSDNMPRRLKVVVRDSTAFNRVAWTTIVDTSSSKWEKNKATVQIPFSKQVPTIFARKVPDQTFRPSNVVGIQLVYSKFDYDGDVNPYFRVGDVQLQVQAIKAY